MLRRALLILALAGGVLGCENYQEHWEDYDKDHPRCRTSAPHFLTGTQDTVCHDHD